MIKLKQCLILLVSFFICLSSSYAKSNYVLVAPCCSSGNTFWQRIVDQFEFSTKFHKLPSVVIKSYSNRFDYSIKTKAAIKNANRGDYIFLIHVFHNYINDVTQGLDKGINIVNFNTQVPKDILSKLSKHRNFKQNFSHFYTNDYHAGEVLIKNLDNLTEKKIKNVLLITGTADSLASIERERAAYDYIKKNKHLRLLQKINGLWDRHNVERIMTMAPKRYDKIDIVWAASDSMAHGAFDGLSKVLKGSEMPLIGGIDWDYNYYQLIKKNPKLLSVGGHFLEISFIIDKIVKMKRVGKNKLGISSKDFNFLHSINVKNIKNKGYLFNKKYWESFNYNNIYDVFDTNFKVSL